jgi:DNA end-binding protein Ku
MAQKRTTKQRPIWKGFLKVGLVTMPIRAFSARVKAKSEVDLDWLHRDCHRRIQYKKVCPVHGEVSQQEIVSGSALGHGRYVVIEPEELAKLRAKSDKVLTVEKMVDPEIIDCRYFTDKSYFVLPDGAVADKPYSVIVDAMQDERRAGIAHVVLFRREQLILLRVVEGVMMMTVLNHQEEFAEPAGFASQIGKARASTQERNMAVALIDALSDEEFDFGAYKDNYVEQLQKLIRLKAEGKEIAAPEIEEEPEVLNLMDALRGSLKQLPKTGSNGAKSSHPRRSRRRKVRQMAS